MATRTKKAKARKKAPKRAAKKKTARRAPTKRATKVVAQAARSATYIAKLPLLWSVRTSQQACGLWVDELVWAGNDDGEILVISRDGDVVRSHRLPGMVRCLLADDAWKYAGCSDGKVYDLTGRVPRAMYEIEADAELQWLEVYRGTLLVSDENARVTAIDVDGVQRWQNAQRSDGGWMVRADGAGVYHGTSKGARMLDWDGKERWSTPAKGVGFGWQDGDDLIVAARAFGEPFAGKGMSLHRIGKTGKPAVKVQLRSAEPDFDDRGAMSCAARRSDDGSLRMFASCGEYLFCTDGDGKLLWEGNTGAASACTMQIVDDRLYMAGSEGAIACIDVSDAAIDAARNGKVPKAKISKAPKVGKTDVVVERTSDTSAGVIVECLKDGGKLRMRVASPGYHTDWYCQFPRDLREEGARFVVDEVREAAQGGFYRVLGDIKRVD